MDENDVAGSDLKYVLYSLVYAEPNHEALLQDDRTEAVLEGISVETFARRKVTEFLSSLRGGLSIPDEWRGGNHPVGDFGYIPDAANPVQYSKIPEPRYVQVQFAVVGRMVTKRSPDESQLRALDEIERLLDDAQE